MKKWFLYKKKIVPLQNYKFNLIFKLKLIFKMKKLFVSIVAAATVFVFTSCGSDIEITIPGDDLTIDLGDRTKALEGVSAKGKKDIPKEDITIEGLDFVGNGKLIYTAKDESGNQSAERGVTIKTDLLWGTYKVTETDLDPVTPNPANVYDIKVEKSGNDVIKLLMDGFGGASFAMVFAGDGKSTTLTMEPTSVTSSGVKGTATGEVSYSKLTNGYAIQQGKYKIEYEDGDVYDASVVFERK